MKVIDLLNKIANKEEVPKKIKVLFNWFEYDEDNYCYKNVDETLDNLLRHLGSYKGIALNCEIELEDTPKEDEKILEKLQTYKDDNYEIYFDDCYKYIPIHKDSLSFNEEVIVDKINEIIDKVNKL